MRLRSFNEPHLQQRHAIMIAIPLSGRAFLPCKIFTDLRVAQTAPAIYFNQT
jgi:hypothetical protein